MELVLDLYHITRFTKYLFSAYIIVSSGFDDDVLNLDKAILYLFSNITSTAPFHKFSTYRFVSKVMA